jgi:signal transduction histidine kinase
MKTWLRGKPAGLISFVAIAGLVAGGLGWATAAALRLEGEQLAQRAESERANLLRLALWRLDSRISPLLAREDSRPFNHYSAVYPLPLALNNLGACWPSGAVLEPSPLLGAELPPWMLLHFQADRASGWESPQVLSPKLTRLLGKVRGKLPLDNVTPERQCLLAELSRELPARELLQQAGEHTQPATVRDTTMLLAKNSLDNSANSMGQSGLGQQNLEASGAQMAQTANPAYQLPTQEYNTRRGQQAKLQNDNKASLQRVEKDLVLNTFQANGSNWFGTQTPPRAAGAEVLVNLSPMVPVWLETTAGKENLVLFRLVHIADTEICQGIVLDVPALQEMLAAEVADLFPEARLLPMREREPSQPERTMTALPFQLDPGPSPAVPDPRWTPLRVGLALAWLAALVALLAVGLGGWSLLDLSERRIRFVSAVTHELRTPLTTLRLYLDMLVNGLVRDEQHRGEYIHTLHSETDRLNRLVGNVLDFSRLENQRPRLNRTRVPTAELLDQLRSTWAARCQDAEKELLIENLLGADAVLWTDRELVQQILGNLIDNACKYSRGAEDRRLWVRVCGARRRVVFEIEDRGPGVPSKDRQLIFRAFRRGRGADETAGGVGLGLALARRWARLLGGQLTLQGGPVGRGACFRLELPRLDQPVAGASG